MNFALPSLLATTNNWGAFLFFAACCLIAQAYVFFMVPETAGLSVEELDAIFDRPWFQAYKSTGKITRILEGTDMENQKEWVPDLGFSIRKQKLTDQYFPGQEASAKTEYGGLKLTSQACSKQNTTIRRYLNSTKTKIVVWRIGRR